MKRISIFTALIFLMLGCVFGQEKNDSNSAPQGTVRQEIRIQRQESSPQTPNANTPPNPTASTTLVISGWSLDKVVKGAPYSADAVTETVQTLADGNRIVHKTASKIYRDSEGRTRRETVMNNIGPYAVAGDVPQIISINDPVAKADFILDSRSHTARKTPYLEFGFQENAIITREGSAAIITRAGNAEKSPPATSPVPPIPPIPAILPLSANAQFFEYFALSNGEKPKKESLGTQTIEGVAAEGTRTTFTIAAGKIGNERAIDVIDERWYSPELQTVVMSKHSDPRFGETVYQLTNINRSEPDPSLFQVPAGYTVTDFTSQIQQMKQQAERINSQIQRMRTEKKDSKQN